MFGDTVETFSDGFGRASEKKFRGGREISHDPNSQKCLGVVSLRRAVQSNYFLVPKIMRICLKYMYW